MSDPFTPQELPEIVQQYIKCLARSVRNRHMRQDVLAELSNHFADALADVPQDSNREELAASLVSEFGDTKLLAKLIKRAKKRCRPMWVKFVIRTCQTLIVLMSIFAGYTWWFVSGEPTIRIDYIAKLNEMVRPDADDSLNAAPHYLKAGELYVSSSKMEAREVEKTIEYSSSGRPKRIPRKTTTLENVINLVDHPGCTLKPGERQALNKWIEANQPAIDQLRLGTAKPYCWFRYSVYSEAEKLMLMNVILPHQGLRAITNALSWQMQFSVEEDDWESIAGDLKSIKIVARHLMNCPFLIEQLIGTAIDKNVNDQLIRLLRSYPPSKQMLNRLAVILAQSFPAGYPIADSSSETLFLLDLTQWLFTDDGSGDGHLIPSEARNFFGQLADINLNTPSHQTRAGILFENPIRAVELSMLHPSRRQTVAIIEKWKEMADSYRLLTPYQNYISGQLFQAGVHRLLKENPRNLFIETLLPGTQRVLWKSYAGQAKHEAAQTIVALLRYEADHGQFPDSLDQLVPQYLKAVPQDPFGPGPLTYKRQRDDFVLHRLSLDFKDNGSKYDFLGKDKGDYVFWPPEPVERPKREDSKRGVVSFGR